MHPRGTLRQSTFRFAGMATNTTYNQLGLKIQFLSQELDLVDANGPNGLKVAMAAESCTHEERQGDSEHPTPS